MTSTPPPRSPKECPPAPLWPAKYEHPREVRRSSRIAAGKQAAGQEPSTPTRDARTTPPPTAKRDKKHSRATSHLQTPMKKKSNLPATPSTVQRSAKTASRISKFSLDQRSDSKIMIFEDISARVPDPIGDDEDDIFKASSPKRRKTDSEAEFQPPTTDGMVVVQRGRKSFKKFEEPSVFTGPMPRKNLFGNYPRPAKAAPPPAPVDSGPLATDDEETEREDSPEPPTRNVRFVEAETSTTTTTTVMNTPAKATRVQHKTPRRTPKSSVEIETSFLTPPATIQRDDTSSSFGSLGGSFERSSVKRKLSYSGPATPEATPAKKRSKISAGIGTPRDDDVFGPSTRTRRGKARS
ncbi:hypothetical protein Dda_8575 [Drechslerella dactyloides]|uniref:Uncharacterized protein n=1 Tax=Drechslerella dactyloides TaxID=74499 RepID=A0AAD6IQP1_DREDA|nr:hypothetical protein Dda_8575 [Drechslerella dactyloides]